jgi:hypothetical protein
LAGQKHLQLATTWFRQYFPVVNSGQENGQKNEGKKGKFRLDLVRKNQQKINLIFLKYSGPEGICLGGAKFARGTIGLLSF